MRTLVIGLPLPHVSFDNFSFLSAPSFFDYEAMIVEAAAVSRVIEDVMEGRAEHRTHDSLPVVNGPGGTSAMGLTDLLRVRRLETERFLGRGGLLACFAYSDAPHPGVDGFPDCRRYSWLPAPSGLSYAEPWLLPGFGHRGAEASDPSHPFAHYVGLYGSRLAFRAHFDEQAPGAVEAMRVFARSPGGAAVGVEVTAGGGTIVFIPPLGDLDMGRDRMPLAQTLAECIEAALQPSGETPPHWMRKETAIPGREEEEP
ncbi:MAG: hypothetical protein HYS09_01100 [Chloroflexi bacterium]|nr:hypothetical protein [Chloroflexota bacterium]